MLGLFRIKWSLRGVVLIRMSKLSMNLNITQFNALWDVNDVHGLHRSFSGHDGEGQLFGCHKPQEDPR